MPEPHPSDPARSRVADPLAALRARTADVHEALEAGLPLLSDDIDLRGYADSLAGFHALHAALEPAIDAALAGDHRREVLALRGPDASRSHLARRDLDDLADLGVEVTVPGAPGFADVVDGTAAAVGARYVVEGSTLGGAVLAAHLRGVLGPDVPVRFLAPPGATARWRSLRVAARGVLGRDDDVACAAEAARAVFERFARVLVR